MFAEKIDRITFDNLVESSKEGTFFSLTKWLDLYDSEYDLYGVFENGLIGGWGGFKTPQPITQYQSILFSLSNLKPATLESKKKEIIDCLIPYLPSHFATDTFDVRPLIWKGYTCNPKYTYTVHPDINSLEKETRYEINHSDIIVEVSSDSEWFCNLYEETFKRKGLNPTADRELVKKVLNLGTLYKASDNSCGVVLLKDSKRYYYILGASKGNGTSSKVLWEAIKDKNEIDLVGCNNEKIGKFKKGFAGNLKCYFDAQL